MATFDWNQFPVEGAKAAPSAATPSGGKFDWNQFPVEGAKNQGPDPTPTESKLRSLAAGYVGNFDDELIGALGGAGRVLGLKNLGAWKPFDPNSHLQLASPTLSPSEIIQAYRDNRDAIRADEARDIAVNPGSTIEGNLVGAALSPLGKLRVGEAAADASKGAKILNEMKTAAVQGGIYGAGSSNADLTRGQVGQFAKDTATGMAFGAAVPPALEGIKGATGLAGTLTKWTAKKALSNIGTVAPETINTYLQFSNRINQAPSEEALKDITDQFVGKLASDVDAKKLSLDQAKEAYKGFQADLKDAYRTAGYDARDAVTSAKQTLNDAHGARLQQLSGDLYDTINQLKSDVQSGSQKALDLLDRSDATRNSSKGVNPFVDLSPVNKQIDSTIAQLQKAGTDESLAVADKLQAYKERLASMAGEDGTIPATDAKKLIQGIDRTTKYSPMAGAFDDVKNSAFKDVRRALDDSTKTAVPEYRAAMEPVAADADLLNRVQKFGDRQAAVNLLRRVDAPNQLDNRAALQDLGRKYGIDFLNGAKQESLPEYQLLQKAEAERAALRPDRVAEKIDQTVATSRQKSAFDSAQSEYESAQEKLAPYKSLAPNSAGQTQAQQKLQQLAKGKNIELERMFTELGKLTGTDFVQAMKDRNVLNAFQKGATNGSRNTLIFSLLGGLLGHGIEGAFAGGSIGRVVDQWGPAITKKILDGTIRVSKSPTAATIASLDLPPTVKRNMLIGLEGYLAKEGGQVGAEQNALKRVADSRQGSDREPAGTPARGAQAWMQKGLENLGIASNPAAQRLFQTREGRALLIEASDLPEGSPKLMRIKNKIQKGYGVK